MIRDAFEGVARHPPRAARPEAGRPTGGAQPGETAELAAEAAAVAQAAARLRGEKHLERDGLARAPAATGEEQGGEKDAHERGVQA